MPDGDPKDPKDGEQLPLRYQVVESEHGGYETDPTQHYPFGVGSGPEETPAVAGHVEHRPPPVDFRERIGRFAESPTRLYATIGVGLGILFGIVIAIVSWNMSSVEGPYDLGAVISTGPGLKGHLFLEWDRKLKYRLSIEPSDKDYLEGFSLVAGNPPRPLSINIQLQNAEGFVLCTKDILLKFDAGKAAALAARNPAALAADPDSNELFGGQLTPVTDLAKASANEAAREQGKDVFLDQVAPSGFIDSIHAEGVLPCAAKAYETTSYWSLTPNFPSVAEQGDLLRLMQPKKAAPYDAAAAARRKAARNAPNPSPFYIEGDDSIVGFDASTGTIETATGRRFLIDKAGKEAVALKTVDLPADIHYKCDQAASCTITRAGGNVIHSRMRR